MKKHIELKVLLSLREMKRNGKTCNCCGLVHRFINTEYSITHYDNINRTLIFWNCECDSTLVRKIEHNNIEVTNDKNI